MKDQDRSWLIDLWNISIIMHILHSFIASQNDIPWFWKFVYTSSCWVMEIIVPLWCLCNPFQSHTDTDSYRITQFLKDSNANSGLLRKPDAVHWTLWLTIDGDIENIIKPKWFHSETWILPSISNSILLDLKSILPLFPSPELQFPHLGKIPSLP